MIFIEIDISEVAKSSFIIIDIRDEFSYQKNHLKNTINVPFTKLIIEPGRYLNKKNKYLLVCEYGIKSKKTASILNNMGYHTFSLKAGIKNKKINY